MTTYTDNIGLEKYDTGDAANLRDQYNSSMDILDTQLKNISDQSLEAANKADAASEDIAELTPRVTQAEIDIDTLETTTTNHTTQITELTSRVTTAESDIDALELTTSTHTTQISSLTSRVTTAESDIDTLETTTTNHTSQITSLTSRLTTAESDIDTLETTTTNHTSQITSLTTQVSNLKDNVLICIGDSFTDTSVRAYSWPTKMSSKWTVKNYATPSVGFRYSTNSNGNFVEQLSNAYAEINSTYNNDRSVVKGVIIYGGYNDFINYKNDASVIRENLEIIVGSALTYFPQARIICAVGNAGWYYRSAQEGYSNWTQNLFRGTTQIQANRNYFIINANWWLWGFAQSTVFNDDLLHPNEQGAYILARYFEGLLAGSFDPASNWFMTQIQNNDRNPSYVHFNPAGELRFSGMIATDGKAETNSYSVTGDARFCRDYNQTSIVLPYYCANTNLTPASVFFNPQTGLLRYTLTQDGICNIYF